MGGSFCLVGRAGSFRGGGRALGLIAGACAMVAVLSFGMARPFFVEAHVSSCHGANNYCTGGGTGSNEAECDATGGSWVEREDSDTCQSLHLAERTATAVETAAEVPKALGLAGGVDLEDVKGAISRIQTIATTLETGDGTVQDIVTAIDPSVGAEVKAVLDKVREYACLAGTVGNLLSGGFWSGGDSAQGAQAAEGARGEESLYHGDGDGEDLQPDSPEEADRLWREVQRVVAVNPNLTYVTLPEVPYCYVGADASVAHCPTDAIYVCPRALGKSKKGKPRGRSHCPFPSLRELPRGQQFFGALVGSILGGVVSGVTSSFADRTISHLLKDLIQGQVQQIASAVRDGCHERSSEAQAQAQTQIQARVLGALAAQQAHQRPGIGALDGREVSLADTYDAHIAANAPVAGSAGVTLQSLLADQVDGTRVMLAAMEATFGAAGEITEFETNAEKQTVTYGPWVTVCQVEGPNQGIGEYRAEDGTGGTKEWEDHPGYQTGQLQASQRVLDPVTDTSIAECVAQDATHDFPRATSEARTVLASILGAHRARWSHQARVVIQPGQTVAGSLTDEQKELWYGHEAGDTDEALSQWEELTDAYEVDLMESIPDANSGTVLASCVEAYSVPADAEGVSGAVDKLRAYATSEFRVSEWGRFLCSLQPPPGVVSGPVCIDFGMTIVGKAKVCLTGPEAMEGVRMMVGILPYFFSGMAGIAAFRLWL